MSSMTVRFRRSHVFDSKVQLTPDIEAALAEIDAINLWFRTNKPQGQPIDTIRAAGPKAMKRTELQTKVREYFQEKLGPDFILIGWGNDAAIPEPTFRGDCRVRSDSGHERPKRKRRPPDDVDLGGSD